MKVSSIKYLPYSATVLLAKAGHPDLCGVIKSACSPNLYNCIHNLYVWDSVIRFFKTPDDSCDHSKLRSTVQKWAIKETSHPSLHQKLLKAGPVLLHYTIGLFQYVWRGNCERKKKKKSMKNCWLINFGQNIRSFLLSNEPSKECSCRHWGSPAEGDNRFPGRSGDLLAPAETWRALASEPTRWHPPSESSNVRSWGYTAVGKSQKKPQD